MGGALDVTGPYLWQDEKEVLEYISEAITTLHCMNSKNLDYIIFSYLLKCELVLIQKVSIEWIILEGFYNYFSLPVDLKSTML